jgi:hypothetical protein
MLFSYHPPWQLLPALYVSPLFQYPKRDKHDHIGQHHAGPGGSGVNVGDHHPNEKTDHRNKGGPNGNGAEGFADPQGTEGRKDDQA